MSKEKIFIVLSHKHSLKKGSRTEWELTETVEFVNQLRNKHLSMSVAIGDYLNRKMLSGERRGINDYTKFEDYIRTKYGKQLAELDVAYRSQQIVEEPKEEVFSDEFGNVRPRTVFDPA